MRGNDIDEEGGEADHQAGEQGELLADVAEADIDGDEVQQDIDEGKGQMDAKEGITKALDEQGEARNATRVEAARQNKGIDIHSHDDGSYEDHDKGLAILFPTEVHLPYS
jgi:hypothetical protein